jgi:hypothetical protein
MQSLKLRNTKRMRMWKCCQKIQERDSYLRILAPIKKKKLRRKMNYKGAKKGITLLKIVLRFLQMLISESSMKIYISMSTPFFNSALTGQITCKSSLPPHSIVHLLFKFPFYPDLLMCRTFDLSAASECRHFKMQNSWACTAYFLNSFLVE